ncbi:AAA family ATPase [Planomicrobium chinense]|uniref:chloramphenicol phosphotransferase CPT family protein n=1 Tax=Planococcus chinensis TaxID=272917 RepID=UPI001CC4704F|nr:AAA family ATPase [Planococcus chinensis]MBZ5200761.1 AAA family ATPase [Planococcus chinensis]
MDKGTIILLNGTSSSGKTTLANELIKQLPDYFALSIDEFDGIIEQMEDRDQNRLIPVPTEYYFHRNIAMFSESGIHLVVDQILHDDFTLNDCLAVLKDYPVLFVGVHCPLDEIEKRESQRGDRPPGLAKKQLEYVHQQNEQYDLEVDTSKAEIAFCADRIKERLENKAAFTGWAETAKKRRNSIQA